MKTTISTRPFDAAEYLNSEASIAAFVSDAMESGDPVILQNALNTAARARGIAEIAQESGLGRESLYKALRPDAKPQFATIVKVLGALGVKLVPQAAPGTAAHVVKSAGVKRAPRVRKGDVVHVAAVKHVRSGETFHAKAAAPKPAKRVAKRQASRGA